MPTNTPVVSGPTTNKDANLRTGPGTEFGTAGGMQTGQSVDVVGRNADGTWLVLGTGAWIAAFLVNNVPTGLPIVAAPVPPTATAVPASQGQAAPPSGPGIDGIVLVIVTNRESLEILALRNSGNAAVDVSGWRLDGSKGDDFCIIPGGTTLQPGEEFDVATGDSVPRGRGYTCGDKPIWNNSGESIYLKSTDGRVYQIESRRQ